MLKSKRPDTADYCEVLTQTTPLTKDDDIKLFAWSKKKRLLSACTGRGQNRNTFASHRDFKNAEQADVDRIPNYSFKKHHKMGTFFSAKNFELVTTKFVLKSPPLSPKLPQKQEGVK